jgi:hypothetical protein
VKKEARVQHAIIQQELASSRMKQVFSIAIIPVFLSIVGILVVVQPPEVHAHSISLEQIDQSEFQATPTRVKGDEWLPPLVWHCGYQADFTRRYSPDEVRDAWLFSSFLGVLILLFCFMHSLGYRRALSKVQSRYGLH